MFEFYLQVLGDFLIKSSLILFFYCCITNHHKHSNLKKSTFIISLFPWIRSPDRLSWSLLSFMGYSQGDSSGPWPYLRLGGLFQVPVVADRIHFLAPSELMVVGSFKASSRKERVSTVSDFWSQVSPKPSFKGMAQTG